MFDQKTMKHMLKLQKDEITDYRIYSKLAKKQKNEHNRTVLENIARDELDHYNFWKEITKKDVKASEFHIWFFFIIARIFGLTFGIRLKEKGELKTQHLYTELKGKVDGIESLLEEEEIHEEQLIDSLAEEKLNYIGSIVLGLNDALVELTGTLAGLTFGLANSQIVAFSGLITGIAASFSMASSEYLSAKQETSHAQALKSALYTGGAYIVAVILLILPYLLIPAHNFDILGLTVHGIYISLAITLLVVVLIILFFNYYISVAKRLNFKQRFLEMVTISLGVAVLSFFIGRLVGNLFGIEI